MPAVSESQYLRTLEARAAGVDISADGKTLSGYAIVFNSLSEDLGGWKEIISPSAVDRTLRDGTNVNALIDHREESGTILGSTDTGLLQLQKDRRGLKVKITPVDTMAARDVITTVKAGLVKGMSFRFRLMPDGATWDERDGLFVRTVTDMSFSEVSIVLNPAYKQTEIGARALALDAETFRSLKADRDWKPSLRLRERMARAGDR
jgi:HK97 family phage prohead protease